MGAITTTGIIVGTTVGVTNVMAQQAALQSRAQIQQLQHQMAAMQAQQVAMAATLARPAAAGAGSTDLVAQLKQLLQLKSAGLLSNAEFAAAKAKLLA
jgi:transcription initiation factor TFIID subunit TAF12